MLAEEIGQKWQEKKTQNNERTKTRIFARKNWEILTNIWSMDLVKF